MEGKGDLFYMIIRKDTTNALKGQFPHSSGQRPEGYSKDNYALKGLKRIATHKAFALSGRCRDTLLTQGVALGC